MTFSCHATGEPSPDIEWYKDDTLIVENDRLIVEQKDGVSTLTMKNVATIDEAVYKALARNPLGAATSSSELLVKESAVKPELLEPLKNIDVKSGQAVSFSVRVKGDVKVDWYKDDELLLDAGRVVIVDEQDGETFTLAVEDARVEDAGVYKCVARNEAGEVSCNAALKVSLSRRKSRKANKESQKSPEAEAVGRTMELTVEGMLMIIVSCNLILRTKSDCSKPKKDCSVTLSESCKTISTRKRFFSTFIKLPIERYDLRLG